jgi:effector-binding domain-containing protein
MPYAVRVLDIVPHPIAAARGHGRTQNYIKNLFALLDEVWRFLRANPQVKQLGLNVFLYWGDPDADLLSSDPGLPIEAGVKVAAPFESTGRVTCSATPGGTVATVAHIGPYEKLPGAHSALRHWCKENNRQMAGTTWEEYGHWNEDPAKLRTDVFYLLK